MNSRIIPNQTGVYLCWHPTNKLTRHLIRVFSFDNKMMWSYINENSANDINCCPDIIGLVSSKVF